MILQAQQLLSSLLDISEAMYFSSYLFFLIYPLVMRDASQTVYRAPVRSNSQHISWLVSTTFVPDTLYRL